LGPVQYPPATRASPANVAKSSPIDLRSRTSRAISAQSAAAPPGPPLCQTGSHSTWRKRTQPVAPSPASIRMLLHRDTILSCATKATALAAGASSARGLGPIGRAAPFTPGRAAA
jgi:hypothetical protein